MSDRTQRAKALKTGASAFLGLGMVVTLGLPAAHSVQTDEALFKSALTSQELNGDSGILSQSMKDAEGTVAVFVQFKGKGAYESTQPAAVLAGQQAPVNAQAQVQAIAAAVEKQGAAVAAETGSKVLYTAHNSVRGVAIQGDAAKIRELAQRSDVAYVSPIVEKFPANGGTTIDTESLATWTNTGFTGKNVKIAVIDTGVDYTHTQFGGPGTQEAYEEAFASTDMPAADSGLYDPEKFVGGYDLVGDAYNASSFFNSTPKPDSNPLDCRLAGHGTHVAGTAAGYAVQNDGSTFKGDYTKLTEDDVRGMKIGAGAAPEAQVVGLRVFGCQGSTNVSGKALDMALDPNGDGVYDDRVDVVNMSLGSDYAPEDDPDNLIVDALTRNGILSVVAAGNSTASGGEGDTTGILGSPSNAVSALAVANTIGSTGYMDKAEVLAPSSLAGNLRGSYSGNFNYAAASEEELTGEVVLAPEGNPFACDAFPEGTDFEGKWILADWQAAGTTEFPCGSGVRFNNAEKAGAKGILLATLNDTEDFGIAGNATIPGMLVYKSDADKIRAAAKEGTLKVKMSADGIAGISGPTGKFDQVNSSTSRGYHGSKGIVKPDVAAPGTNIGSAGVGTGNGVAVMTGTSMATPHVAGVAALVMEANQAYGPTEVKAAIMNSAVHDVKTAEGAVHSIERVGAGRVDALKAVNQKVLAYNADTPWQVSQTFGVVEAPIDGGKLTFKRDFTVDNSDSKAHTYSTSFAASSSMPGVEFTMPKTVTVEAGGKAKFTVTATVDPAKLEKVRDASTAETQLDLARQFVSTHSGRLVLSENGNDLRIPLNIAPKPVSTQSLDNQIIFSEDETSATITPTGGAVNSGGYTSKVGAFELGHIGKRTPTSTLALASSQAANLQYVGATTNVPQLKAEGKSLDDAKIAIGISTWGNWGIMTPAQSYEIHFDTDGDGTADHFAVIGRVRGLDLQLVQTYKIENNRAVATGIEPLNGAMGNIDTNLADTNTMVAPVSLEALGISEANPKSLSYRVVTAASQEGSGIMDSTSWIPVDPFNPYVAFTGKRAEGNSVLLDTTDGNSITVERQTFVYGTKVLFLHMQNGTGDLTGVKADEDGLRAQVVTISVEEDLAESKNPRFTDVPTDHQFYKEIAWLADKGITTGYPDGTYRPADNVERAAMAAFFYRMAGSPQYTAPAESPFKDVPTNHQFYKEIAWMAEQGITTGYPDGTFRPGDKVHRAAMAAFFYRAAGEPAFTAPQKQRFNDVAAGDMFYKEIAWLSSVSVTTGYPDGSYKPAEDVHRAAMAAFIYRYTQNVQNQL